MHLPTPSEGGSFTPPPPGTHPAVCYRFIDLGTQVSEYQGERKSARKVMISWEITDADIRMEDGRPFTISNRYTWSMHEKATLRKTLESWRGVPFVDSDFGPGGFDVRRLIGVGCLISVIHNEKGGKLYANLSGIMKLPKGMAAGEQINERIYLSLEPDSFDRDAFGKLSESLQNIIKASPEYQSLQRQAPPSDDYHADYGGGHPDDDIPF